MEDGLEERGRYLADAACHGGNRPGPARRKGNAPARLETGVQSRRPDLLVEGEQAAWRHDDAVEARCRERNVVLLLWHRAGKCGSTLFDQLADSQLGRIRAADGWLGDDQRKRERAIAREQAVVQLPRQGFEVELAAILAIAKHPQNAAAVLEARVQRRPFHVPCDLIEAGLNRTRVDRDLDGLAGRMLEVEHLRDFGLAEAPAAIVERER